MVIFEDANVKLDFVPEIPAIIWKPLRYLAGDTWRKPFVTGMDFMEEKIKSMPNLGWINDARLLKVVKPDDLMWLNSNVNDRAYRFGAKKVAFVLPESAFGKLAVKFYVDYTNKRTDNQFQIKAFSTLNDAQNWISSSVSVEVKDVNIS
ncbi:MAG TPA: hypothetical protein VK179_12460 [Bacteroidales bacterium]|nr:hypothetical protein [Bacteroidales bacterium]